MRFRSKRGMIHIDVDVKRAKMAEEAGEGVRLNDDDTLFSSKKEVEEKKVIAKEEKKEEKKKNAEWFKKALDKKNK